MKTRFEFWRNFDHKNLRGGNFEVFPFLRVFPPTEGRALSWVLHFGWAAWTVGVFCYNVEG